jgi:hypothetical protein
MNIVGILPEIVVRHLAENNEEGLDGTSCCGPYFTGKLWSRWYSGVSKNSAF